MDLTGVQLKALYKRDRKAFLNLYEQYFSALCVYARSFSLDHDEAEDVVQDVFCKLFEDIRLFDNVNSLKSYLYKSVRNGCLLHFRNEKNRKNRENEYLQSLMHDEFLEEEIIENEFFRQLYVLVEELPPQCRIIFEKVLKGTSSEDIAKEINLSIETVKTQRKKAKRIIKERFSSLYNFFSVIL